MIKINMGCGKRNFGPDWFHVDGGLFPHTDWKDITKLPFANGAVDLIYASHVIEYFDRDEVVPVLKEWKRVLKPGGVLRLAVPDFIEIVKLYCETGYELKTFLGPLYGKLKMGDTWIYHKTVYDAPDLRELLYACGFNSCRMWDWRKTEHAKFDDHSQAYIPHMNKNAGNLISLNIECSA